MNLQINALICLCLLLSPNVLCSQIIGIEASGVANGSLGDTNFTNANFTMFGSGDVNNVFTSGSSNLLLDGFEVSIEIEGAGFVVFTDAIQAVSNNNSDLGGFGNTSAGFGLLLVANEAFETYDLLSDLEPVSGAGVIVNGVPHQTTGGNLRFFDIIGDVTISAAVKLDCFSLGDLNQDGSVNLLDVGPFVDALTSGIFICEADLNEDGDVNLLDVEPFVQLLGGG